MTLYTAKFSCYLEAQRQEHNEGEHRNKPTGGQEGKVHNVNEWIGGI